MIINSSRAATALLCWRKAFNSYHRNLQGQRSMNLVDGGAFHKAVAHGMATKDWAAAKQVGLEQFDLDKEAAFILPQQEYEIADHREIVERMVECYQEAYGEEQYQVVQPECEFVFELPGSGHNCVWLHWWDLEEGYSRWGEPPADKILRGAVGNPHVEGADPSCKCWQPHRVAGRTDALVLWHQNLWLLEHKTTSIAGEQFWGQFRLDIQPTIYMLGMWRSTGVRPSGFVVNAINKPSENQVANWNSKRKYGPPKGIKDYIKFDREAFTRTEEDLLRCERELSWLCQEWEQRIVQGRFPLAPTKGICYLYNRACDFHGACLEHDSEEQLTTLYPRQRDYINLALDRAAGLQVDEALYRK